MDTDKRHGVISGFIPSLDCVEVACVLSEQQFFYALNKLLQA
jgi:hypothetical protein